MPLLKSHDGASPPAPARSREALVAALGTALSEPVRRAAALELGTHADRSSEFCVHALGACLRTETFPGVREAIVTALVGIGTVAAAGALAEHLHGEDVALRNDAIEGLREIGAVAGPHVEDLLVAPDPDVRIFAINVLESLRHARAPEWLHRVLAHDTAMNVCLAAVEAMAQVGGPEDVPRLRAFVARFDDEPFVAFAVDAACRLLGAGAL
jgi:HEAT repeat protein